MDLQSNKVSGICLDVDTQMRSLIAPGVNARTLMGSLWADRDGDTAAEFTYKRKIVRGSTSR